MNHKKQERYLTEDGSDWIDKFFASASKAEVRGAMAFTIGKYLSRLGKKDTVLNEVEKVADYSNRWLEYERGLCNIQNDNFPERIDEDI